MANAIETLAALRNRGLVVPDKDVHFRVERNFLVDLMADRVARIKFDESWYLGKYPDVGDAVKRGVVASGREHYVRNGYYEHRMPTAIVVNEKWYLDSYGDVAAAIRKGIYKSAQAHFETVGYLEGRLPFPNFRL